MGLKTQALSGVKWTTTSTVLTTIIQFGELTILANLLSPEDFGLMGMIIVILGFAQAFSDMGLSAAIIHKQEVSRDQLSSLYWVNIGASTILYILVVLMIPVLVWMFSEPRIAEMIPYAASIFILSALGAQFRVLFEKELEFNFIARRDIIAALAGGVTSVTLAFSGYGVWALIWGAITNAFFGSLLVLIPGWEKWRPKIHFAKRDLAGFLSFGLYQMGERVINYFNSRFDQLIIGILLGANALGYYSFAFNLVLKPSMKINPIITRVAFPVFSKIQTDIPKLKRGYLTVLNVLTVINAPILIGFCVIAPLAVPLIFGEQWNQAIILIQILSIFALIRSTGNPVGSLQLAKGRADLGFKWNLGLLFVISPAIYIGIKLGGLIGVVVALAVTQFILSFLNYIFMVKPLIGRCALGYAKSIVIPVIFATIMGITVYACSLLLNMEGWIELVLLITAGGLVYALVSFPYLKKKVNLIRSFG